MVAKVNSMGSMSTGPLAHKHLSQQKLVRRWSMKTCLAEDALVTRRPRSCRPTAPLCCRPRAAPLRAWWLIRSQARAPQTR